MRLSIVDQNALANVNPIESGASGLWLVSTAGGPSEIASIAAQIVRIEFAHVMVSGEKSEEWHDAIDAAIEDTELAGMAVTTWHEDETLNDVAWQFLNVSFGAREIDLGVILHSGGGPTAVL